MVEWKQILLIVTSTGISHQCRAEGGEEREGERPGSQEEERDKTECPRLEGAQAHHAGPGGLGPQFLGSNLRANRNHASNHVGYVNYIPKLIPWPALA